MNGQYVFTAVSVAVARIVSARDSFNGRRVPMLNSHVRTDGFPTCIHGLRRVYKGLYIRWPLQGSRWCVYRTPVAERDLYVEIPTLNERLKVLSGTP